MWLSFVWHCRLLLFIFVISRKIWRGVQEEPSLWSRHYWTQCRIPLYHTHTHGMSRRHTHTRTHTNILWLSGFCPGQPGWARTRRNIHPLTPIVVISHPLSASSIYYNPRHPPCLSYVPDKIFPQSLSEFSSVYLLAWHPLLHTPYISSSNRCLLFAAHAHTIVTWFGVVLRLSSDPSLSFNPLLGILSCSFTPHIHLTILISAHWSATSFSFLMGQVSLSFMVLAHLGCPGQNP